MNELERTPSQDEQDACPPYTELDATNTPPTPEIVDHEALGIDFAVVDVSGPDGDTRARVADDGTIDMWLNLDGEKPLPPLPKPFLPPPRRRVRAPPVDTPDCPPLNIAIFVVGSRGELRPNESDAR
jgi:hypothetical protein